MGIEAAVAYFEESLDLHGPVMAAMGYTLHDCHLQYKILGQMGIQAKDSVLDVGCGLGFGSTHFVECYYKGIDGSARMIDHAKMLQKDINEVESTKFQHGEAVEELENWDWLLLSCIFSVGYSRPQIRQTIRECYDMADKGVGVTFLRSAPINTRLCVEGINWWLHTARDITPNFTMRCDFAPNLAALYLYRGD